MSQLTREVLPYLKAVVPDDDTVPELILHRADAPLSRPFVGGLITTYVRDTGDSLRFVSRKHLAESQLDAESLHAAALENLVARVANEEVRLAPAGGLFAVLWDGNFEATLLLHPDFWEEIETHVGGPLVAVAPARDVLAVGRADAPGVLAELRAVVDRAWPGGDHLLARDVFARRDGAWVLLPRG